MSPQIMFVGVVLGLVVWAGSKVEHGVKVVAKKSAHAVVKVVTLGHKQ